MKLKNPDDDTLNAAFAEKVAGLTLCDCGGWTHLIAGASMIRINEKCQKNCCPAWPQFTRSADAVLPWLERQDWYAENLSHGIHGRVLVEINHPEQAIQAEAESFPRAAVICLLRSHGVEIEFTP